MSVGEVERDSKEANVTLPVRKPPPRGLEEISESAFAFIEEANL